LLHSSAIGNTGELTLEDEVLINLDEKSFRKYPVTTSDTKNSIAWHLWHITRIEDMTMNILIDNDQQVLFAQSWLEKMNNDFSHSGNNMNEEEIAELSSSIDFDSLLAYREAVGRQTRQVVSLLKPGQFKMKVEQDRIKRLFHENAVTQNANWLADSLVKKALLG
jgi:hypothetical protein